MQLNLIFGFVKLCVMAVLLLTTACVSILLGGIKDRFQMTILQITPKGEHEDFGKGTTRSPSLTLRYIFSLGKMFAWLVPR